MIDVVMPSNNEQEFIGVAKQLGIKGLVFLYSSAEGLKKANPAQGLKITAGLMAENLRDLKHAKRFGLVFAPAERQFAESRQVDVLLPGEEDAARDSVHQRNSGLNEVLCRAGKQKIFALSFGSLLCSKERGRVLGRQMQNVRLLRKHGCRVLIASFAKTPYSMKAPRDLIAYGELLGMHPAEAKAAANALAISKL